MTGRRTLLLALVLLVSLLILAGPATAAQGYSFAVPELRMQVFIEPDASARIVYDISFANNPSGRAIDIVASNRHTRDGFAVRNVFLDVPEQLQDVPVAFDVAQPDSRTRRRDGLPSQ